MTELLFKPRDAARLLGVSYPALKQWVYKRKLRTVKTPGGHHRIPQSEVDRLLYRAHKKLGPDGTHWLPAQQWPESTNGTDCGCPHQRAGRPGGDFDWRTEHF